MQKLFKGGNYSRAETIRGNTVVNSHILPLTQLRTYVSRNGLNTGIPRFTLLIWGPKRKTAEAKTA